MSRTFKPTKTFKHYPLRHRVVEGSGRNLVEALRDQMIESNKWYVSNVRAASANTNTTPTVRQNVIARLYRIAKSQAERQLGITR